MEKFQTVLLNVWREACRHIEIDQSVRAITPLLLPDIPLGQLWVRRVDLERNLIETLAQGLLDMEGQGRRERAECSAADMDRLARWCRRREVSHLSLPAPPTASQLAVPAGWEGEVLIGPLDVPGQVQGVLVLAGKPAGSFNVRHIALAQELLEPFSVALANDCQLRELARLRQAAEADKVRLLTRLGRVDLGDEVVGDGAGLRAVMERVDLVATSDVPVLIFGETGTGKELIARAIHRRSPRSSGPIIRVNCGAIPPELIDSELFGHQRGAFTGATETRQGWFERADGGTLFLDEIGELPRAAQVRLLRILQDGWLERVGGGQPIHVDVRVVAATHRNLAQMVADGSFREDLWYRISVFPIFLPPLRDRKGDIPALTGHFVERAARRFGLPVVATTEQDIELLSAYAWPGNVRELAAVIDRAAILGEGQHLDVKNALGVGVQGPVRPIHSSPDPASAAHPGKILSLDAAARQHIETALHATKGRVEGPHGAAKLLAVNPHTLRARMRKLGIVWQRFRAV